MRKPLAIAFALSLVLVLCAPTCLRASTEDEDNNVEIYRGAAPGVVNISSITLTQDFFFNIVPTEGAGSGVVVDERGYVLTNQHVIANASKLMVTFSDGTKSRAELAGSDPDTDIAVLKVASPPPGIKAIPIGDSEGLEVGQKVLAMGNPFGLGLTLTTGVVSSLGRTLKTRTGREVEDVIQTDAAINPGNSGGPLLNSSGEIIGINTFIFSPTGASVGIGFAIPINTVKMMLADLIEKGYYPHPYLGVSVATLEPSIARELDLPAERGALLVNVVPGSPADNAGLSGATRRARVGNVVINVGGDIVVGADNEKVDSARDLIRVIRTKRPGESISLTVVDNRGVKRTVSVVLGERPRQN